MTEPKVDDRVRCTLGENVIVGKVLVPVTDTHPHLSIIYGDGRYACIKPAVWTVEVIEPEPDNFPATPGLYEVTWEDGQRSRNNPYQVRADGRFRFTHAHGSWSDWMVPIPSVRRATWKRLPDPLPPEPPIGTILRDRYNNPWWRLGNGWKCCGDNERYTWQQIQEYGPFARQIDAPDPNDEQQVEALAQAMRRADGRAQLAGLDVARAALTFLRDGGA